MSLKVLVTGGCGFIGSNLVNFILNNTDYIVLNIDKLTYAGNLQSLSSFSNNRKYFFKKCDISNYKKISSIVLNFKPDWIMHLAAESHVDRSIESPDQFIKTNIFGTFSLLNASLKHFNKLSRLKKKKFRFHHISTDEVYGDLGLKSPLAKENNNYFPSSPYSASKAGADHLVRAWHKTYGLPIVITNTSNNYGPYQFPEKLIPHTILNILNKKRIPVYGNGKQIRDWIYVEDHVEALIKVVKNGKIGETYNIGGNNQIANIKVVKLICKYLDKILLNKYNINQDSQKLISFVKDRPGHDVRYGINQNKILKDLNWKPKKNFKIGIQNTIEWYLENKKWWKNILSKGYKLNRKGKAKINE